jgi:hypothetical protein
MQAEAAALVDHATQSAMQRRKSSKKPEAPMSDDKIMCIVNAPRIEIVLAPEDQSSVEGDEVADNTQAFHRI